jgi:hypothetical protein
MPEFKSIAELIKDLKSVRKNYKREVKKALGKAGKTVQKDAKALFGTYQDGWAPLKEITKEQRVAHGYPADEPLLVTGGLRDAVKIIVEQDGAAVFVGVDVGQTITGMDGKVHDAAEIMGVHEYGSTNGKVPARPIFGIIENRIEATLKAAEDSILKGLKL